MTDCPPVVELARLIDHSALHPTLTDADLEAACRVARDEGCATICIKPYAVPLAAARLKGSRTGVCTVIGFPHGSAAIGAKVDETLRACADGAAEIDMVVNVGKVLSGDWGWVQAELVEVNAAARSRGALVKVIFENDFLKDEHIVRLCRACTDAGVAWVKTSSGFGYVKQPGGGFDYRGATEHHLRLMQANVGPGVQLKAAGGVRTLDDLLTFRAIGCTRIGATATVAILDEARRRRGEPPRGTPAVATPGY